MDLVKFDAISKAILIVAYNLGYGELQISFKH